MFNVHRLLLFTTFLQFKNEIRKKVNIKICYLNLVGWMDGWLENAVLLDFRMHVVIVVIEFVECLN